MDGGEKKDNKVDYHEMHSKKLCSVFIYFTAAIWFANYAPVGFLLISFIPQALLLKWWYANSELMLLPALH